ncbi:hypothetical protein DL769_001836 [Monosporascus sp. CRB-8-3]|nr:hypothetical protein DL769_001836 [Monosporascus sp. CRB-8-3]
MLAGNLQRNAYNRRRPRREPTLASSASVSSLPPGIANGPPTELLEGGVYILISTHDRNYVDHDDDAPLRSSNSSSSGQSAKRGDETSQQGADERPSFTWSLYLQRTPHLGTLYRPGEPARGVFSIVPRPRARVPVVAPSPSPEPDDHHRLIGLVQVDGVADAAAMDRAAAAAVAADGKPRPGARPHPNNPADERAWALAVLRGLRGQCRTATAGSELDLLEAVDGWAARVASAPVAAPVAFWWRRDWCWEVPGRVPRDWRDLAYRRYSCDAV